jgi:hypothetical protein
LLTGKPEKQVQAAREKEDEDGDLFGIGEEVPSWMLRGDLDGTQ